MTFLDLFAGIGGFRRGMELAGHRCVGFCDWDRFAVASYTSMHLLTDEQREQLAALPLKQRQEEILKEEYRNGEWYASNIRYVCADEMPRADCWTFGAPCQEFSYAGTRIGLAGQRSSLVREVFRILRETKEINRPEWLVYENVKGILSSNSGVDYLSILLEMEELGYDVQWQIFNSKDWGVPQNRERVYTVGHLRARGDAALFSVEGADGANQSESKPLILNPKDADGNRPVPQDRVYDSEGISCAVTTNPTTYPSYAIRCFIDKTDKDIRPRQIANTITATEDRGLTAWNQVGTAVLYTIGQIEPEEHKERPIIRDKDKYGEKDKGKNGKSGKSASDTVMPIINPGKENVRQHGRRVKDAGDPAFTLTATDRHGVAIKVDRPEAADDESHPGIFVQLAEKLVCYAIWYKKQQCYVVIRKLTPRECFRLQGWTDDYFDRAAFVNSDSQLYKQAGNGVTVNVVYAIGCAIRDCTEDDTESIEEQDAEQLGEQDTEGVGEQDAESVGEETSCQTM